jgi:hypothetical protein
LSAVVDWLQANMAMAIKARRKCCFIIVGFD